MRLIINLPAPLGEIARFEHEGRYFELWRPGPAGLTASVFPGEKRPLLLTEFTDKSFALGTEAHDLVLDGPEVTEGNDYHLVDLPAAIEAYDAKGAELTDKYSWTEKASDWS